MDALRKAYQRAVQIPLNNVEQIWQEYNQFENNMSKMTVSCSALPVPLAEQFGDSSRPNRRPRTDAPPTSTFFPAALPSSPFTRPRPPTIV